MKFQSLLLLILPQSYLLLAQPSIPVVKPLGPEATALYKVFDRPIGTCTGTVPIQFQLFGVSSGPLRADISLSYNGTGGIRVEETASCVVLGFALNDAGGRITQA